MGYKARFLGLVLLALTGPAGATVVIDFGTGDAGPGGTITITASGITGSNIPIDDLIVTGAPMNNGDFEVTGTGVDASDPFGSGVLNFNCTGSTQTNCSTTNSISITGGVPLLGIANGSTLLTGSFSSVSGFLLLFDTLEATGSDTKPALYAPLGLAANFPFDLFGFSIGMGPGSPTAAISTDIRNTGVPEPGTLALFGFGGLGMAWFGRRRRPTA